MTKKLFLCGILAICFLPAISQVKKKAKPVVQTIKGVCNPDIKQVYLVDYQNNLNKIDSAAVVKGTFAFRYNAARKNDFLGIGIGEKYVMFINDGQPTQVNLKDMTLKGSALNQKLNRYDLAIDSINAPGEQIYAEYQSIIADTTKSDDEKKTLIDACREKFYDLQRATIDYALQVVKNNRDNIIPAMYINYVLGGIDSNELKDLLNPQYAYVNHPAIATAKKMIEQEERKAKVIGTKFIDLTLNDVNETPHKLSEYCGKGNYVLIDFWASWCGPCRAEMPNVRENYEKYHEKGFDIVGISFDNNVEAWKKAIADMKIDWIHLSDLKAWKSEAGKAYGIDAIPASLLVDPQGTIIARDLREEALGEKLKEIYGF